MKNVMDKITPLDSCGKNEFRHSAHRLIGAQRELHQTYHGQPDKRDIIPDYNAVVAWSTVTCAYSGIEQAMKCLLQMRGAYIDKPLKSDGHKHHHIGKLFQALAFEEQEVLRTSYGIYRSLHDYIPPETINRFLDAIDDGYPTWRYFLLEGKMPPTTHAGAMLEIWSALSHILKARVFTNHGLYSVEKRGKHHLNQNALQEAWGRHIDAGIGQREIDDMNRWMQSHKNIVINAYIDLFFRHAEGRLDLIEVLPSTREVLNTMVGIVNDKWVDNDFSHFLHRARMGEIVWNPDKNLFEKVSRSEEIKIRFIESEHSYVKDLLGHSVRADFIESVPAYIEDFIFEPRIKAEIVDEDWSVEDEARRARKESEARKAEIREYEGGNECEGYSCHINGTELVIVLYDSKEWIVYRYNNDSVPGVPFDCKDVGGQFRSIREAIKAIEHWRRTEKNELEAFHRHRWNRRGKRRNRARREKFGLQTNFQQPRNPANPQIP